MNWKDQLYNHEVTPPENVWSKICHDLDNGSFIEFKQQLAHHETAPPVEVWEKICQDLDNHSFITFKDKLRDAEIAPPAEAWENITAVLNPVEEIAPIITLKPRTNNKVWRLAAAAAVVGILFTAINYFFITSNQTQVIKPGEPPVASHSKQTPAATDNNSNAGQNNEPAATPSTRLIASTELRSKKNTGGKTTFALGEREDAYESTISTPLPALVAPGEQAITDQLDLNLSTNRRIRNLRGEIREDVSLLDLPNSYFYTTGPNGQTIRVSSKFRNTIQYLNGEGSEELLDVILRESGYWKNLFREWKEKVANSAFTPSANNFMDITELLKLLQQNQRK